MRLVKREHIKVRREYGKPVLERERNWKEKKPRRTDTPDLRVKKMVRDYREEETARKLIALRQKQKLKAKKKREWEKKMRRLKKPTGSKLPSRQGTKPKRRYVIRDGKAYPIVQRTPVAKKQKSSGLSLSAEMSNFGKEMMGSGGKKKGRKSFFDELSEFKL